MQIKSLSSDILAKLLVEVIRTAMDPLKARNRELEARIKELESSQLRFVGTFDEAKSYAPNHVVRRSGSAWICVSHTSGDFDHKCWELLIKKGDFR
jgi:hypothetical protein